MTGIGGELSAPGVPGLWEIEWGPDGRPMLFGFNSLSGRVIADIPLPVPATQISSTGRAAAESPMIGDPVISGTTEWVGSADEIVGVDLLTHRVIAHVHNPAGTIGVLVSDGSLWVSTHSRLERLSETTGQMTAEINLPDAGSCGISPAADGSGEIVVVTYSYPCNAADVATGTETIYTVGSARAAVLHRFTLRVRSLQVAPGPFLPVAVTPGLVWGADADIAGREGPELVALDQATGRVRFALALHLSAEQEGPKLVASAATTASFAFGYLWVAAGEDIALVDPSTGALLREMAIVPARAYENSIINGVAQDEVSSVSFTPNDVVVHLSETGPSVEGDVVLQPARTAGAS
jgi:hypothetical protein